MGSINPPSATAKLKVVPGCGPGSLLEKFHLGHAVLGKQTFFFSNDQWRRVRQRNEAQRCTIDLVADTARCGSIRFSCRLLAATGSQEGGVRAEDALTACSEYTLLLLLV